MKSFYRDSSGPAPYPVVSAILGASADHAAVDCCGSLSRARVAVYEAPGAAPRVEEISPAPVAEYIEALSSRVYQLTKEAGGDLPYTVVRELAENLIHADFAEPVISILNGGAVVRFADQGPGIPNKDQALIPGFTTAKGEMKAFIRGVGSGLPIVRDFLTLSGGTLLIEDNLGSGSVVTVSAGTSVTPTPTPAQNAPVAWPIAAPFPEVGGSFLSVPDLPIALSIRLSTRQKQVLALVLESGSAGPSLVSKELGVGVSTAYRDLASLEEFGLISADGGKRAVTDLGLRFLDDLMTH